jgi:hypothetical protein
MGGVTVGYLIGYPRSELILYYWNPQQFPGISDSREGYDTPMSHLPPLPPDDVESHVYSILDGVKIANDCRPMDSLTPVEAYYGVIFPHGKPVPIPNPRLSVEVSLVDSKIVHVTHEGKTYTLGNYPLFPAV